MFSIKDGRNALNQWEQGQMLTNPHMATGKRVFFRSATGETCIMFANGDSVEVPNVLLQTAKPIIVDLEGHPECRTQIRVNPAEKPANYVFIDNALTPAPSWNGLTDKPEGVGYAEMKVEFPETTLAYTPDLGNPVLAAIGVTGGFILDGFCPIRKENYEIIWNGVTYRCSPGVTFLSGMEIYLIGMGNFAAFSGGGNTGEPFIIANLGSGVTIAIPLDGNTSPVVEIKREVTNGIPEKYHVFYFDIFYGPEGYFSYTTYGQVRSALKTGKHIVGRKATTTRNEDLGDKVQYTYFYLALLNYDGHPEELYFVQLYAPDIGDTPDTVRFYAPDEYNDATIYKAQVIDR